MSHTELFQDLPAHSRLWIYSIDRSLNQETEAMIDARLSKFMAGWQSHGRKVTGRFAIVDHRFILIAAEIPEAEISGCGIDASVHALEDVGRQLGFNLLTGLDVLYRGQDGTIQNVPRAAFRKLVRSEQVTGETMVFDTSLVKLEQLRQGAFELPAHASWHAMVFRIPATST